MIKIMVVGAFKPYEVVLALGTKTAWDGIRFAELCPNIRFNYILPLFLACQLYDH